MSSPTHTRRRRATQRHLQQHRQPNQSYLGSQNVPQRKSARLQSRQLGFTTCALGSVYETPSEKRPTDPPTSHPSRATLSTHVPSANKTQESVPSQAAFCTLQIPNHYSQKRPPDSSIDDRPLKRTRLTEQNLKAFEKMGRQGHSLENTGAKTSTITTTNTKFKQKLMRNNIVLATCHNVQAADDAEEVRNLLDQQRQSASESSDRLEYKAYLRAMNGLVNESTVQTTVYRLLSGPTPYEVRASGYGQQVNYAWSEVDNHLTQGLSHAKPDIFESFDTYEYPPEAVDNLSSIFAPTSYDIVMPAFAVQFKGHEGSMPVASWQCAYHGALMTESAHAIHEYTNKPKEDFFWQNTGHHSRI